jgi:hypothetical protein
MGEAGGGLPENSPSEAPLAGAGEPRRPPSLPLVCIVFAAYSSFSVFRGTPMAFFCDYFKKLNCYKKPA